MSFLSDIGSIVREIKAVDGEIRQTLGDAASDAITTVTVLKNEVTAISGVITDTTNGVKTVVQETLAQPIVDENREN